MIPIFIASSLVASDPITIDSLFKKQSGIRSVTTLSILSTGNSQTYESYPNLSLGGDPTIWNDTKSLILNQTLIYTLNSKVDLLSSFVFSYNRKEYVDIRTYDFRHEDIKDFNSMWFGLNYKGDSIGDILPQITFQAALYQKERVLEEKKNFYLKSYSLKGSLRGYSDPVIWSIYASIGYNAPRKFNYAKINYGNILSFGGDMSIALSPKITLDLGAEQRFQTEQKVNGVKNSNLRSIPTYSIGSTYSLNEDTSISFSTTLGGSSAAPDSIFGFSLWKKF